MSLNVYIPKFEDLWFRQSLMSCEKTMSYNHNYGGTIKFPKSEWENFYKNSVLCDNKIFYYAYLLLTKTGEFVGDIGYRYDNNRNIYIVHLLIKNDYRGKGYGSLGLKLICEKAKENGINILYDDIAIDNTSFNLFIKNGFVEEFRTNEYIMLRKEL